ncbi:MAG: alpha/beta hydrolase [Promethearchaeota archaeon]
MVSKELETAMNLLRAGQNPPEVPTLEESRAFADQLGESVPIPEGIKYKYFDIEGVPVAWVTGPNSEKEKVIIYLHGGAYVMGSIVSGRVLTLKFSQISSARILAIDYRLAPENPYPAGLNDIITVYKWCINSEKIEPKNIIIAGSSAGGGLTLAALIRLRDENTPLPAAGIAISPWADLTCESNSFTENADVEPWLTPDALRDSSNSYVGENDPKNPHISTIFADFKGIPPLFIQVGGLEILLDDSTRIANNAKKAGIDVELDVWEELFHVFVAFPSPESRQATEKIKKFIDKVF